MTTLARTERFPGFAERSTSATLVVLAMSPIDRETGTADDARTRAIAALEEQLRVQDALRTQLRRFNSEIEHLIASLSVIHGELVRMSVAGDTRVAGGVASQVRDLRAHVTSVASDVDDTVDRLGR